MFDVGFSEIAVIGVVALVVLGPERLPKVARTAGHLFGRLQRYVHTVKADINREIDASEFAKVKQEVTDAAKAFETTVQSEVQAIEAEGHKLKVEAAKNFAEPAVTPTPETQAEILAKQAAGMDEVGAPVLPPLLTPEKTQNSAPLLASQPVAVAKSTSSSHQGFLDFGIEPVRQIVKKS